MVCDYEKENQLVHFEDPDVPSREAKPSKIVKEARDIYEEKLLMKELGLDGEVWD